MKKYILSATIALLIAETNCAQAASIQYGHGALGVTITGNATHSASAGHYTAGLNGDIKAIVVGAKLTLAEGDAKIDLAGTAGTAEGHAKAFGVNIFKWSETVATGTTKKLSVTPYTRGAKVGGTVLAVGPVRLKLDVGANVTLGAEGDLTARLAPADSKPAGFTLKAGPYADASASASMSLDAFIAKAWVDGSVSLGKKHLVASLEGDLVAQKLTWGAELDASPLTGKVTGNFRVGRGWFRHTWKSTLWSYSGESKVIPIFSETVHL